MGDDEPDDDDLDRPSLAAEDHALWWRRVGEDELRQLLYWRWDPVQVSDSFPATKDEYDGYVGPLMAVLRDGARAEDVFDHLRKVEIEYMGGELSGVNALTGLAYTVIGWYYESIARWADNEPPH
jgi:predicted phosphohydrolase